MRGKPGNEVLTKYSNYLFLPHMYSYYSTFIVAFTYVLLDMTSQMLFCTLPIASIMSN